jgi:ribonuclease-3
LREALTHRSYLNEHPHVGADNQRLEFLGDALLGVTVTLALWPRLTHANEGELSATRARLINATTLARCAERVGLEACLRVGKGEPNMGEKAREARLADALEALIGALTLDLGEAHARAWLWSLLSEEFETLQAQLKEGGALLNVKSRLLHLAQRLTTHTPRYERLPQTEAEQSKHPPLIKVRVWVGDEILGEGEATLRQRAEERAAEVALEALTRSEGRSNQTARSPLAPSKRSTFHREASRKRHSSRS